MRRYDHHVPFELDGFAALQCCFASASGIPTSNSAATEAVSAADESCLLI
jgi:hypothetical protein